MPFRYFLSDSVRYFDVLLDDQDAGVVSRRKNSQLRQIRSTPTELGHGVQPQECQPFPNSVRAISNSVIVTVFLSHRLSASPLYLAMSLTLSPQVNHRAFQQFRPFCFADTLSIACHSAERYRYGFISLRS